MDDDVFKKAATSDAVKFLVTVPFESVPIHLSCAVTIVSIAYVLILAI
jgi:hypothetical protein